MITNDRTIIDNWYIVYTQHFIVGNSLYKPFISLILEGIPNHIPKILFALSSEHASWAGNIVSIIILDVYMVGLMDEEDWLSSAITHANFRWWSLLSIFIILSFCILIPSVWLSQFVIFFFKHLLKSYMSDSYCDGWNLMRCWLISVDYMHKWTAYF